MSIWIVQVPHRMPPRAWRVEDEGEALALLSTDNEEFDNLDDAVGHDVHAGFWARSKAELIEKMGWLQHQRLAADRAVSELEDEA